MKKLLKKKYFVPLLVVVVMAIAATTAYAWWTASVATGDNTISTGTAGLTFGGDLPVTATGLVPQAPLTDAADEVPVGYRTSEFWVKNSGNTPLPFYGWLEATSGNTGILGREVWVKIVIAPQDTRFVSLLPGSLSNSPGPHLVYHGPIGDLYGEAAGRLELTTEGRDDLAPGQYAVYKAWTYLHGPYSTDDSQGKSMTCTLNFKAILPE